MFLLLLCHIAITLICALSGILVYDFIKVKQAKSFIFYPISGFIAITFIQQIVALFRPVNLPVFVAFVGFLLVTCILKRRSLLLQFQACRRSAGSFHSVTWFLFFALVLTVLVLNAGPTIMDDTESYHIQMVKWIQEYGTVPGLANLHERYGFNSSWFSSISFFLPFPTKLNYYTALNGTFSIWLSAYLIFSLPHASRHSQQQATAVQIGTFLVLLFSLFCWPLIRGNSTTANYDFVTSALTVILFVETVKATRSNDLSGLTVEWILWPLYLCTVRTVNFPLLILSLYGMMELWRRKEARKLLSFAVLGLFLLIPFIARTFILSGYPFYPAKQFAVFNVDWKVPEKTTDRLLYFIKYFNRVNTMYLDISETEKLSFPNWIPTWFHFLFRYDKFLLLPGVIGLATVAVRRSAPVPVPVRIFIAALFLQLISWFFIAPDPRFVYGALLAGVFLLARFISSVKIFRLPNTFRVLLIAPLALGLLGAGLAKVFRNKDYQNFLAPIALPQPPIMQVNMDGILLRVPEKVGTNWNARCYATDLPCLYLVDPELRARGTAIKDGFRIQKQ